MKKMLLLLCVIASIFCAQINAQVATESGLYLPSEGRPAAGVYPKSDTNVPLVPRKGQASMVKPSSVPLSPTSTLITTPPPIPLVAPEEPRLLPSNTISLEQYSTTTLYENPVPIEYRIMNMQLNDFGVAMARKAGLNYIYNPNIRGTVNGFFRNTDPIYMLHMAAKANGYKLVIKDGILAELQRNGL